MNSESMRRLSALTAALADVYARLKAARSQLKETPTSELAAQVKALEAECDKATDDLQAAYASMKRAGPSGDSV